MKIPGLYLWDDPNLFDFHPDHKKYINMVNGMIRRIAVNKGHFDVEDDAVIYSFMDGAIICRFTVWMWENKEKYELLVNPHAWNKLPSGISLIRFRCMGMNQVYNFQYYESIPMMFAHIPGDWVQLLKKYQ